MFDITADIITLKSFFYKQIFLKNITWICVDVERL